MLHIYPQQATEKLEFDKIKQLLISYCQMADAKKIVEDIRLHTRIDYLKTALEQTREFKMSMQGGEPFPSSFTIDINKELQLLKVPNAMLTAEEMHRLRNLTSNMHGIMIWFKKNRELYPQLLSVIIDYTYEKEINKIINHVIDENAQVKDGASNELLKIRQDLSAKRQLQRRLFEKVLRQLTKESYLADIAESFLNGRCTVAVLAEHKRKVKGILHGESDSGKTVFIEPEETIAINNEVGTLVREEQREIVRILRMTTAALAPYREVLQAYYKATVFYDFIAAKARLAIELNATMPQITSHPSIDIVQGYHPILLLHNKRVGKATVPIQVSLNRKDRILMISGPNAGGKTVTMKTIGLLQLMLQAGLLIPVDERSVMGIFKQLFIHIGDTQSIENELSTYSSHLKDMKYFVDFANGKTLFFIDELGSGSDPNLGGAFAEAIVETLAAKQALGVITTHYLNLKVMADHVNGIINGAMAFDEQQLEPLYQLEIGKPGSSYTFAIAERVRLAPAIIDRARALTERAYFDLDRMLHKTEKQTVVLSKKDKDLSKLLVENEKLKAQYEGLIDKEKKKQQQEILKLQNKIKKEELDYLRDMERKFKQIIVDWKKTENKQEVIQQAEKILFRKKQIQQNEAAAKKADQKYQTIGRKPEVGDLIRHTTNHQIGTLVEILPKSAKVKIGKLLFTINLNEWITVREKSKKGKKHAEVEADKNNINPK